MQLGMIGLGRMGANMVRRLLRSGHECVVFDSSAANVEALVREGARGSTSLDEFVALLAKPRAIWIMVPAGAVDACSATSRRSSMLVTSSSTAGTRTTSTTSVARSSSSAAPGVRRRRDERWRLGTRARVLPDDRRHAGSRDTARSDFPLTRARTRGDTDDARSSGEAGTADQGYLHCGPVGAGHFVKMVHNGIEYGLMAAYAEGGSTSFDTPTPAHPGSAASTPRRPRCGIPNTTSTTST